MLKDAGAQFVLIGHSERRQPPHEDNAFINRKVLRALECGLDPLLCVGETYEEHQENKTSDVLKEQLTACLQGCSKDAAKTLMIAYEPVWAIGTGLAATADVVEAAMKQCKEILGEVFDTKSGNKIPLLYGGSVNAKNAENYLNSDEIDGLLIGSASLATDSFAKIISLRQKCRQQQRLKRNMTFLYFFFITLFLLSCYLLCLLVLIQEGKGGGLAQHWVK